jgi:hypothetical protein
MAGKQTVKEILDSHGVYTSQLELELLRHFEKLRREIANEIVEMNAIIESIEDILDGKEVSDFMESFPIIRKLVDMQTH